MDNYILFKGYDPDFLKNESQDKSVSLPVLNENHIEETYFSSEFPDGVIPYINYSVVINKARGFSYFSASNINGKLFQKIPRKDNWSIDKRVKGVVWESILYKADRAKFDRGHLTKREDVQWGENIGLAFNAANSTFYYPNAVPQHKDLNRDVWRSLEDYILHTETAKKQFKICVFTGPVFRNGDPYFVTPINDINVQLPILFWKVVVFQKENGQLYKVGFLMSHHSLLVKDGVIEDLEVGVNESIFMNFKKAGTYQVNTSLIEDLAGLKLPDAKDSYIDERPIELIFKEIEIDPDLESDSIEQRLGFTILQLVL